MKRLDEIALPLAEDAAQRSLMQLPMEARAEVIARMLADGALTPEQAEYWRYATGVTARKVG